MKRHVAHLIWFVLQKMNKRKKILLKSKLRKRFERESWRRWKKSHKLKCWRSISTNVLNLKIRMTIFCFITHCAMKLNICIKNTSNLFSSNWLMNKRTENIKTKRVFFSIVSKFYNVWVCTCYYYIIFNKYISLKSSYTQVINDFNISPHFLNNWTYAYFAFFVRNGCPWHNLIAHL